MNSSRLTIYLAALTISFSAAVMVHGQLAITEVMSSASKWVELGDESQWPDFWELTNFGTNVIELSDYRFNDDAGLEGAEEMMFRGIMISPNESIIFSRMERGICTNAAQFRAWWGDKNLPANLQIYFFGRRRFSSVRDAVQLWRVTDSETNLIDRVELYPARSGITFTYDLATGFLDSLSATNSGHGFKAEKSDDIGSPGFTAGPIPLFFFEHPKSVVADAGSTVVLKVAAGGLPRPHYQWRHEGNPIAGAVRQTYELSPAGSEDAGSYRVELSNGIETVSSSPALVEINTLPAAPSVVVPPQNMEVAPTQTAVFEVKTRGYSLPSFQWQIHNENILDATNAVLRLPDVTVESAGMYSVRVWNENGSTNASATLTVRPKPNLVITEMMGARSTNSTVGGRRDWWELSNFDTRAVDLQGYMFDDFPGVLEGAFVIKDRLLIQPGESIVFIQEMTAEDFRDWWGKENLPENLQFVRYYGNGIEATKDSLTLWNATPRDGTDWVSQVGYLNLDDDFNPRRGVSLTYWPGEWLEFGQPSVPEEFGAFVAASSEDIGSPGYVSDRPPRALEIQRASAKTVIRWRTRTGARYELLKMERITGEWRVIGQHIAPGAELTITDLKASAGESAFYKLGVLKIP